MPVDHELEYSHLLATHLDLAIGFARLASYLLRVGNHRESREQHGLARQHYQEIQQEWAGLDLESTDGYELIYEKRRAVEECLRQLDNEEPC